MKQPSNISSQILEQVSRIASEANEVTADKGEVINLSIHDIPDLDQKLQKIAEGGNFNEFLKENFPELSDRKKGNVTKDNFVEIQAEATLLSHIQIELIQHISAQNEKNVESKLDGNKIMEAFQSSEAYKNFNGPNGLNTKLKNYKETHLRDIPKIEIGKIDLEVKNNNSFGDVSAALENHSQNIKEKYGANLDFASGSHTNVDQLKLAAMSTSPQDLALLKNTYSPRKAGEKPKDLEKGFQMQLTGEKSKSKKIGKGAAIALTILATLTVGVLIGIAASMAIAALGGVLLVTVGVSVAAAGLSTVALPKISKAVMDKASKIGKLKDENPNRHKLIEDLKKVDTKSHTDALEKFNSLTKKLPKISHAPVTQKTVGGLRI